MSFYVYQIVKSLILSNSSINLSAISHWPSNIRASLSDIYICYFNQTKPQRRTIFNRLRVL